MLPLLALNSQTFTSLWLLCAGIKGESTMLGNTVKDGFAEKLVFEQRLEDEGGNHSFGGKNILGIESTKC